MITKDMTIGEVIRKMPTAAEGINELWYGMCWMPISSS